MEMNNTREHSYNYFILTRNGSTTIGPHTTESYDDYDLEYNYEYEADPGNIPLDELVPVSLVYGVTLVLGLLGNSLVILSVAKFKKMQNVTNMFLLSLASADLLLVTICVPIKCAAFFSYSWKFGKAMCKIVHYVQNVSILCSVMNLTVLSLERYYAIIHPIRAKCVSTVTLAKKTVCIIWIASFFMASPILVGRIHKVVGNENVTVHWCITEWDKEVYGQIYGVYMFVAILVLPLCLMVFAYSCICHRVWILHKQRPTLAQQSYQLRELEPCTSTRKGTSTVVTVTKKNYIVLSEYHTRQQVIKMLVAIVVLFVLCWGPITVNDLLVAFRCIDDLHQGLLRPLRITFFLLSYVNSCTNPVVYAFMSRHFRRTFKQTLLTLCKTCTQFYRNKSSSRLAIENRSTSFNSAQNTSIRNIRTFRSLNCEDKVVTRVESDEKRDKNVLIKKCSIMKESTIIIKTGEDSELENNEAYISQL